MAKPIHSMIRVLQEARSVDFYRRALELEVVDRRAFDGFTLLYLRAPEGPFELELTVNHDRTAPYALGDGYGHLAVAVEDLAAEHARMSAAGIECGPLREMQYQGQPLAKFFFITDPDGYKTEVLQRFGRYA
jgi:lactoylglutathione lyase